jgi:hypothetical protein
MYNGLITYDETFFTALARVLNEETVQPRDLQMMYMLLPLSIERGKEFKPDADTVALLRSAANEAHAWIMAKAATEITPWWPAANGSCLLRQSPSQPGSSARRRTTLMSTREASHFRSILSNREARHRQFLFRLVSRQ